MNTTRKRKPLPTAADLISSMVEKSLGLSYGDEVRISLEHNIQMIENNRGAMDRMILTAYQEFPKASNPMKEFVASFLRRFNQETGAEMTYEAEIGVGLVIAELGQFFGPAFAKREDEEWIIPGPKASDIPPPPKTDQNLENLGLKQVQELMRKMGVGK